MTAIIKKGTNACCFRLKSKKVIMLQPDILVVLSDSEYEELMKEYGSFIKPRIISEKNPDGCFIVNEKSGFVSGLNKEVGEVKDGSSFVEVEDGVFVLPKVEEKEEKEEKVKEKQVKKTKTVTRKRVSRKKA